jgi:hypothetical protein
MMNTRAKACEALRQGYVQTAIAYLRGGIKRIAHLFPQEDRKKLLRQSHEARILLDMLKQIRLQLPPDPRKTLQRRLREALAAEQYEEAAELRDQLTAMTSALAAPPPGAISASREEDERPAPGGMPEAPKTPLKKARKPRRKKVDGDSPAE